MPALVAASPAQQRTVARVSLAAVDDASEAAKDAGFRLDVLLKTENAVSSDRLNTAVSQKLPKSNSVQASTKGKSAGARDGASKSAADENANTKKPKKRSTKKSTSNKRNPYSCGPLCERTLQAAMFAG